LADFITITFVLVFRKKRKEGRSEKRKNPTIKGTIKKRGEKGGIKFPASDPSHRLKRKKDY